MLDLRLCTAEAHKICLYLFKCITERRDIEVTYNCGCHKVLDRRRQTEMLLECAEHSPEGEKQTYFTYPTSK